MIKPQSVLRFQPQREHTFLFDSNVWLDLLVSDEILGKMNAESYACKRIKAYKNFYQKIITTKATIAVPAIVMAEVVNILIRNHFNDITNVNNPDRKVFNSFKDYRHSQDATDKQSEIYFEFEAYLTANAVTFISDDFARLSLDDTFQYSSDVDFNDNLIASIAFINNLILITHDKDYGIYAKDDKLTIVTYNAILLNLPHEPSLSRR